MNEPNSSAFDQSAFAQSSFGGQGSGGQGSPSQSGWFESFKSYQSEPGMESPGFVDYIAKIAGSEYDKASESPLGYAGDVLAGIPRGVVDAGMGIYGLADWATADVLPDWETNPLGTSSTVAGSLVQGVSNFLVGFVPVVGWLGRAGQVARLGRAGQFIASTSRGGQLARATVAGSIADFTVFRGDQERLSNLLTQVDNPLFNNAVTQYLAADGDDGELEGRFKNAVEGLGLGLITDGLIAGLKAIKKSKAKIEAGGTIEEALSEREKALEGARLLELARVVDDAGKEVDAAVTPAKPSTSSRVLELSSLSDFLDERSTGPISVGDGDVDALGAVRSILDSVEVPKKYLKTKETFDYLAGAIVSVLTRRANGTTAGFDAASSSMAKALQSDLISLDDVVRSSKEFGYKGQDADLRLEADGDIRTTDVLEAMDKVDEAEASRPPSLDDGIERTVVSPEDTRTPSEQLDEAFGVDREDPNEMVDISLEEPEPIRGPVNLSDNYPVSKGPQAIINRINREASHGRLDTEEAQFAIGFVQRLGNALGRTGIRFRKLEGTTLGRFDFVRDVVTITRRAIQDGSFEHTFVHEVWHSMERYFDKKTIRMMERDLEKARTREAANREAWLKKNPDKTVSDYIKEVDKAHYGPTSPFYRLTNVREWAAENLTDATLARLDLEEGTKTVFGFFKFFMKNLLTEIKAKFGVVTYDKIAKDWLDGKGRRMDVNKVPKARPLDPWGVTAAYSKASPTERYVAEGRQNNPDARAEKAQLDPKERINWYQATPAQMQSVRKLVEAIDNGTLSQANITIEEAVEKLGISKSWFGNRYLKDGIPDPSESRDLTLVLAEAMNNAYGDAKPPKPTTWKETLGGSLYEMKTMMGMSDVEAIAILEKLRERQIDIRAWLTSAKHIEYMRANTIAKKAKEFKTRFERAQELEAAGDPVMAAEVRREATTLAKGLFLNGIGIERLARANAALSSEVGRTLNILRMTPEQAKKRLAEISAEYMSRGILTKRLDAMRPEEMMEELNRLHLLGEFGPKALQEYANAYKGAGSFWKMPFEVWVNGILSGLKTFVVNTNGLIMAITRPMEMSLGRLLTGQPKEAKEAIRLAYTWTSKYSEALAFASKAWKEERPILANEMFIDDWAGGAIRSDMDNPLGSAINVFGRLVRTPTRVMLFTDEFIKQATARAKVDEMLRAKALKMVELGALDSADMDRWVADEVSRMMYDNGRLYSEKAVRDAGIISARERGYQPSEDAFKNHVRNYVERHFDPTRGRIADEARRYAAEITWQTDLDGQGVLESMGGTIQTLTRKVPFFKLIFPFVRTPTNLMVWLKDRSPAGYMKMYKDFTSGDPTRKADAVGRLSVASGLWITAAIAAGNGVITGRGPKDPRQKKILQDAGWQPYSIKTSEGYISYHRMEPFSFIFGIIADLHDTLNNVYEDPAIEQTSEKIIGATLSALSNSVSEKTYFTGLDMWFDAFTSGQPQKFARLFRNYAASTVPNFAASFVPLVDDEVKEARTALDAMMAKIPGMSDEVEPYRNILGEPISKARSWGPYGTLDPANPFTWSAGTTDPVKLELANLGYGFAPPAHTKDGVDLRGFRSKTGQTAYDRLQELTGRVKLGNQSLYQSLKRLMGSDAYRRMSDQSFAEIDSPRVAEVKRVVARYRKQAQAQLLREFPEINQAFQGRRENEYRMKLGLSPQ